MSDDERPSDVRPFPVRPKTNSRAPLVVVTPKYDECQHLGVYVDEKLAEVTCRSCGVKLNPVNVLVMLAREDYRLRERWAHTRAAIELMEPKLKVKCRHCQKFTPVKTGVSSYALHDRAMKLMQEDDEPSRPEGST